MVDWFPESFLVGTQIILAENGFTSDKIAFEFLKHYIMNSDSGPDADWKFMLMDNHGSYCISKFVFLANENHILSFLFIAHFTHCMQPLDVEIFQLYKHWHDKAIQVNY